MAKSKDKEAITKMQLTTTITSCEMVKGGGKLKFGKAVLTFNQRGVIGAMINNGDEVNLTIQVRQGKLPLNDQQSLEPGEA